MQCTNLLLHSIKPTNLQTRTNSPQRIITRTIWILSFVSLFTDTASEMLYPVMPVFLKHIGFSIIFIGVLEGFAEAVAGLAEFPLRDHVRGSGIATIGDNKSSSVINLFWRHYRYRYASLDVSSN